MAAEDKSKKPKIDLKARLGKTNIGTQAVPLPVPGQSQPPPSGSGGKSPNIAPPPGISPGIPVPPFAQAAKPAAAEAPPPKPTAVQQTIKVEVGEEIIKEREKAKKRVIMAAVGTAILGIAIGYPVGGAAARNERGKQIVANAKALMTDVKAANEKMKELETLLGEAAEKLGKKEYPAELAGQLGGINIPFDATKVDGPSISGLNPGALRQLLNFTKGCEELNKKKDSFKNLLEFAKAPVEKAWKEEKEPVMNFSVLFRSDQKGVIAELVPVKEPYDFGKDWPANYAILKPERTQQGMKSVEKKLNRYTKGDLPGSGDPVLVPVDPMTTSVFTSQEVVRNLRKAFVDLRMELKGDDSNPAAPVTGLIEVGDNLMTSIQKVTQGG
ncbi:formin [Polyangium sorediatum]|uniref:Formin n=1 Tax=Polyangium sorediatum TaxID=889274 RepID=A0ABT6P9N7_9BACT|nr:formin [Polyangium sorediatum]MDI1436982.1 formin [Polyangium sorediatum]